MPSAEEVGAGSAVDVEVETEVETEVDAAQAAVVDAEADQPEGLDGDPVEEFKAQLRRMPGEWYVIHSYAGYENRVKTNLESRITSLNMEDYIFEVEVPMEEVTEIKNGQRKQVRRVRIPATSWSAWTSTTSPGARSGTRRVSPASWATRTSRCR